MSDRTPYWETHIRPMFRPLDREHMLTFVDEARRFDLFDYDAVRSRADKILRALKRAPPRCMPFPEAGGPWPPEWIALFERWKTLDCPRLERGNASGWTATRNGDTVTLSGRVTKQIADETWIDREGCSENPREYVLLLERGETSDEETVDRDVSFPATAGVDIVVIHDAAGRNEVRIT
ncbi:MAG TPA: hypothetical protein VKB93_10775 [Thermoanaerobaculia bacterium]|nr:hypothetical protein [Thermoanaerobaculia bacterium]